MQDTSNVGSVVQNGSQSTLPRLRPFEIATLLLPGINVQVIDASDEQFQTFALNADSRVRVEDDEPDANTWSFDDRCRFINYCRCRYGLDLFAIPNTNNSVPEQKQFANNSQTELIGELFDGDEATPQATRGTCMVSSITVLRDDIDFLLDEMKNSSDGEQKEFDSE